MAKEKHNSDDRLDGLLREWGRAEAMRETNVPPLTPQGARVVRRPAWVRYALAVGAVAAAVVVATAVLLHAGPSTARRDQANWPAAPQTPELPNSVPAPQPAAIAAATRPAPAPANWEREMMHLVQQIELAETRADQAEARSRQLGQLAARQEEQIERLSTESAKLAVLQRGVDELNDQLRRARRSETQTAADLAAVRRQMAALTTRNAELRARLRREYLAQSAPGLAGVAALQKAAGANRLLDRLAAIRSSVQAPDAREALDAVETLLTRLALLDPRDARAGAAWQAAVEAADVPRLVATITAATGGNPAARDWLGEVEMILVGDDHA